MDAVATHNVTEDYNISMVTPLDGHVINFPTSSAGFVQKELFLIFYSMIGAVALFDNFMIVYVVGTNKKMQNFVHILLANMAAADFLCAFTYFTGLLACSDVVITGTGSNRWCLANKTIWLITFQVSSVTMFAVALDRFTAVFFPFYHVQKVKHNPMRRVARAIILIWLAATALVVFTSPSLAYQRYFSPDGSLIHCELAKAFDIFDLRDEKSQNVLLVVANLAHFWLPFLIISVVYGAIVVKVWKRKLDDTSTIGQKDTILLQKWRTIRMIIAAVVVFILCWLPFFIVNIYYFVRGSQHKRPCTESVSFLIVMWLAFSSCCWNPIIYWMYNESYRKGFTDLLNVFRKMSKVDVKLEDRPKRIVTISNGIDNKSMIVDDNC